MESKPSFLFITINLPNTLSSLKQNLKKRLEAESDHDSDSCEDEEVGEDLPEIGKPFN